MDKPLRPKRPQKPRPAARDQQPTRRKAHTKRDTAASAPSPQQRTAREHADTTQTPPQAERKTGTWGKSAAERLAANAHRPRPRTATRPTEQPRTTKKRAQEHNATGNTVSVGGLEISVRALFIVVMVGLLISLIMPSMYQWWRQEQEYREIVAKVEEARANKAEVERQLELWKDEDFIASQARERLGYVRPGETQYSVVDPGPGYLDEAQIAAAANRGPTRPWIQHFAILTTHADAVENTPETGKVVTNPVVDDLTQSDTNNAQSTQE